MGYDHAAHLLMLINLFQIDLALHTRIPPDLTPKMFVLNRDPDNNRHVGLEEGEVGIDLHLDDVAIAAALEARARQVADAIREQFEDVGFTMTQRTVTNEGEKFIGYAAQRFPSVLEAVIATRRRRR